MTAQISVKLHHDTNQTVCRGFDNTLTIIGEGKFTEEDYSLTCENYTILKTERGKKLPENVVNLRANQRGNALLKVQLNN